jgi:acetate kinase
MRATRRRDSLWTSLPALCGLDMLVFTGGIGENDIAVRSEICAGLSSLGIALDSERNNVRGAAVISAENSPVTVRVIPPAEDLIIVNHVVRLLSEQEEELAGAFAVSQQD